MRSELLKGDEHDVCRLPGCDPLDRCRRFGGIYYHRFYPWRLCQKLPPKCWYLYTKRHQITSQKTELSISHILYFLFLSSFLPLYHAVKVVECKVGVSEAHWHKGRLPDWGFPLLERNRFFVYDTASIQILVGWLMTDEWGRIRKEAIVA
jgi:hypothetical protein